MWETAFNVLKVLGALAAITGAVIVCARVWSGSAKDQFIALLQQELKISREHCDQCDKDVAHYRDEMHTTRNECSDTVEKARVKVDEIKDQVKKLEIDNATLLAKTDLSPVMNVMTEFITEQRGFIKEQTEINHKVLEALQQLTPEKKAA